MWVWVGGLGSSRCSTMLTVEPSRAEDSDIEDQCTALRKKLEAERKCGKESTDARGLKSHQVHELAKAKIEESEKLRKALGIREDYEEGGHWKKQQEKYRATVIEKGKEDARREEDSD